MKSFYVLRHKDSPQAKIETFTDDVQANNFVIDHQYSYAIGPFKTRFAAELMADYGLGNPHMQCVDDAEELAALYLERAEQTIEDDDTMIYDVAAESGQIVANVQHMTWFRQAVAREIFEQA